MACNFLVGGSGDVRGRRSAYCRARSPQDFAPHWLGRNPRRQWPVDQQLRTQLVVLSIIGIAAIVGRRTVDGRLPVVRRHRRATSDGDFDEQRVTPCCEVDADAGEIGAGGTLIPNRAIRLKEVQDGLSKTLAVGEATGYLQTNEDVDHRIDGAFPLGWLAGTRAQGTPPDYRYTGGTHPSSWNITTIRYPPNIHEYYLPGIFNDHGANNPLLSPHPGGVNGAESGWCCRHGARRRRVKSVEAARHTRRRRELAVMLIRFRSSATNMKGRLR